MNATPRPARLAAAAVLTLPLVLAGCSDDGDSAAPSSPTASATSEAPSSTSTPAAGSPTSSSPTSSTSSSSTSSSTSTSSSSSTTSSSSASASSSPASSSKKLDPKLVGSCVSAVSKINAAVRQWNNAVRSESSSQRDTAARRLASTAGELRTLAKNSTYDGFGTRARAVAGELDEMKKAHDADRSVRSGGLNSDYRELRTWCSNQIRA